MSRHARYASKDGTPSRDYTYSKWHRLALPDSCTMIDLDGLEYCQRCRMPLLLVEVARDVGQPAKHTIVMERLAQAANVQAIVVLYTQSECRCTRSHIDQGCSHGIGSIRARRIYPEKDEHWCAMTSQALSGWIQWVHSSHLDVAHRGLRAV